MSKIFKKHYSTGGFEVIPAIGYSKVSAILTVVEP